MKLALICFHHSHGLRTSKFCSDLKPRQSASGGWPWAGQDAKIVGKRIAFPRSSMK